MSVSNSLCFSSLYPAVSIRLCLAGLGWVKPKQYLHGVPQEAGEAVHPAVPFLARRTLTGKFLLGAEQY